MSNDSNPTGSPEASPAVSVVVSDVPSESISTHEPPTDKKYIGYSDLATFVSMWVLLCAFCILLVDFTNYSLGNIVITVFNYIMFHSHSKLITPQMNSKGFHWFLLCSSVVTLAFFSLVVITAEKEFVYVIAVFAGVPAVSIVRAAIGMIYHRSQAVDVEMARRASRN